MRKLRGWGSGALLLAGGLVAAAAGQGRADDTGSDSSWRAPWSSRVKPAAKPADPKAEASKAADDMDQLVAQQRSAARGAQEREKYLRRLLVCDRLHDIAEESNDQELLRLAEQLSERAYAAWLQRTSASSSPSDFQSDQATLARKLPLAPTSVSGTSGVTPNALSRRAAAGRTED